MERVLHPVISIYWCCEKTRMIGLQNFAIGIKKSIKNNQYTMYSVSQKYGNNTPDDNNKITTRNRMLHGRAGQNLFCGWDCYWLLLIIAASNAWLLYRVGHRQRVRFELFRSTCVSSHICYSCWAHQTANRNPSRAHGCLELVLWYWYRWFDLEETRRPVCELGLLSSDRIE